MPQRRATILTTNMHKETSIADLKRGARIIMAATDSLPMRRSLRARRNHRKENALMHCDLVPSKISHLKLRVLPSNIPRE